MSAVSIPFRLTSAGVDEALYKASLTLNLNVTHVQIGDGNRSPNGTESALVSPKETALITAHWEVAAGQRRIAAVFPGSASAYNISEIGIWAGAPGSPGSVLVFYWSQATGHVAVKSVSVDFNFENDLLFAGVVPANISIVADTSFTSLAMIAAHRADPDAHAAITTPPQFDDDLSPANTQFVQRALGSQRGFTVISSSATLSAAHIGKTIHLSGSGPYTVTLPQTTALKAGARLSLICTASGTVTVARSGSEQIYPLLQTGITSFAMKVGDSVELEATVIGSPGEWAIVGGTMALNYSASFLQSLTPNGYKVFPGGFCEQWGTISVAAGSSNTFSFNIPFSSVLHFIVGWNRSISPGSGLSPMCGQAISNTQAIVFNSSSALGAEGASWRAIGII